MLEMHLSQNAEARSEAERVLGALAITEHTLMEHPELARVAPAPVKEARQTPGRPLWLPWMAHAAAVLIFCAMAAAGGYFAGRSAHASRDAVTASVTAAPSPPKSSPWAR